MRVANCKSSLYKLSRSSLSKFIEINSTEYDQLYISIIFKLENQKVMTTNHLILVLIIVLHSIWLVSYLNCIFYAFFVKWFSILLKFINKYFRWSRWCTRTQSCINTIYLYKTCYKLNRKREWPMPNKIKIHGIFHKSKNHNSGKPNNINKKLDIYYEPSCWPFLENFVNEILFFPKSLT